MSPLVRDVLTRIFIQWYEKKKFYLFHEVFRSTTEPWQTVNNQDHSLKEFFLDAPE
jgi:hypothetical protein